MTLDDARLATIDRAAIGQVQAAYGDAVSRRAWDELPALFVPGCPITIDTRTGTPLELAGAEAVGEFIARAIERFTFFHFSLLNAVAWTGPGEGEGGGRMYIWELRQDAEGRRSDAHGLYEDDFARGEDGVWRFARRRYRTLARTAPDLQTF